jgi:hypothetical protein
VYDDESPTHDISNGISLAQQHQHQEQQPKASSITGMMSAGQLCHHGGIMVLAAVLLLLPLLLPV